MKITVIINLLLLCNVICFGQEMTDVQMLKAKTQEIIIKKQIAVDNFESQIKDVSFPTIRVFARYKLASWLWKDGADKTERAEQLTIKAIDELYQYKSEITDSYFAFLKPKLFALLEVNSKETANKLVSKYKINEKNKFDNIFSILDKDEKLAVNIIINSLLSRDKLDSDVGLFLDRLQRRKSSELKRVLEAIINLGESGRKRFSSDSFIEIFSYFRDSSVPNSLRVRFYDLVIITIKKDIQSQTSNKSSSHELLFSTINDISKFAPNLYEQAQVLMISLSTRISQERRETIERTERIAQSADKLGAMISEAEKADEHSVKYTLYERAARLALSKKLFELAIEIIGKTIENKESDTSPPLEFRIQLHDQFLVRVVEESLKKSDIASANLAIKKIDDLLIKAKSNIKMALFYYENQDVVLSTDSFNEALKLTKKYDNNFKKVYVCFQLISAIEKIDNNRISELVEVTSKTINSIPTLNIDDKPDTNNYNKYVSNVMAINLNWSVLISDLATNRSNEVSNLAERINKKEIKIIAYIVLITNQINFEEKELKSKTKLQNS